MTYYDRDKSTAQPKMQWPKPHFGSVSEYQVSPWPFVANVTASQTDFEVDFASVTRWIVVHAVAGPVTLSFKSGGEEFVVAEGQSSRLELKCTKIYITTGAGITCSILAGVTSIDDTQFPDISNRDGI